MTFREKIINWFRRRKKRYNFYTGASTSRILSNFVTSGKTADTLKSEVITKITDYNTNTLQQFDSIFRYSKLTKIIDETDPSILSNITTVKIR